MTVKDLILPILLTQLEELGKRKMKGTGLADPFLILARRNVCPPEDSMRARGRQCSLLDGAVSWASACLREASRDVTARLTRCLSASKWTMRP